MAKQRIKKKKTSKKRSSNKKASERVTKVPLSEQEMLKRANSYSEYLTTPEVRHVFNDCHEITIYKMVGRGELLAYRTRNRGKANVYKKEEVLQVIRSRFAPTIAPTSRKIRDASASKTKRKTSKSKRKG